MSFVWLSFLAQSSSRLMFFMCLKSINELRFSRQELMSGKIVLGYPKEEKERDDGGKDNK
ncbi:MAG: hypothetical protein ACU836_01795 [Gammaproteobacteria bacterium]